METQQTLLIALVLILGTGITVYCVAAGYVIPALARQVTRRHRLRSIEDRDLDALKKKTREENSIFVRFRNFAESYQEKNNHRARNAKSEKAQKEMAHKLYAAGIAMTPAAFYFTRNVLTFIGLVSAVFLAVLTGAKGTTLLLYVLVGALGPAIVLRYVVSARVTIRQGQMDNQLPDVLDLLAISVGAGMGFDQAMGFITETMTGPLINELAVLRRELSLGKSRTQAFKDLGESCNSKPISNFAAAVVQATDMGIPLHDMLVAQAAAARDEHVSMVRAKAARASIRMLIPMICFIFPVLFIILMGPAAMNLLESGL
ncbi:tight adherence protein C [Lachnospiraceae bacterium NK3A20]|nr:tight adherence protein C [Lachnospiraceae bacterium NK3A20]